MSKLVYIFLVCFFTCTTTLAADVKSTNGRVQFDVNDDGVSEMLLDATGLGIGTTSAQSSLEINGSLGLSVQTVSANTTLSENTMILVNTSSDNITLELPSASSVAGRMYMIKKMQAENQLWVTSTDMIDGRDDDIELTSTGELQAFVQLVSDGSNWYVMNGADQSKLVVGSDNLVGWWKLDDVRDSTTVQDSSRNAQHGTVSNIDGDDIGVRGVDGLAMYFDGSNDGVILPTFTNVDTSQGTVSVYFKISGYPHVSAGHMFYGSPDASGDGFSGEDELHISVRQNDIVFFVTGGISMTSSDNYFDGHWHHAVATWDNSDEAKLYVDNQIVDTDSDTPNSFDLSQNVRLGRPISSTRYFNGYLDDVRLYNRALSPEEVELIGRKLNP